MEGFVTAVKEIVDCQITEDGTKYFRVCWKDTWEPEVHLLSCEQLLEEFFNSRHKLQEKTSIHDDHINTTTKSSKSPFLISTPTAVQQVSAIPCCEESSRTFSDNAIQCCLCCTSINKGEGYNKKPVEKKDMGEQCELISSNLNELVNIIDKETRDIGCQHEPTVRHFAVQKHPNVEEKVEVQVAEVSVQVSPDVCSTGSQCSPLQKQLSFLEASSNRKITVLPGMDNLSEQCISMSDDNMQATINQEETPLQQYSTMVSQQPMIDIIKAPFQQPMHGNDEHDALLPLSSVDLNQIVQTSQFLTSQLPALSNTSSDINCAVSTKEDVLKEILFVIDKEMMPQQQPPQPTVMLIGDGQPVTAICNLVTTDPVSAQSNISAANDKTPGNKRKRRFRRSSEHKQQEEQFDQKSVCPIFCNVSDKIIYSRSLFPTEMQLIDNTIDRNKQQKCSPASKMKKKASTPVVSCTDCKDSTEGDIADQNIHTDVSPNLNESIVSTVYDVLPNTVETFDSFKFGSPSISSARNSFFSDNERISKNKNNKRLATRSSSVAKEEKSINDAFIAKYWK